MDVTEETKLCPNCKHQISCTNFDLHTIHCQRSLTLCSKCDEAIPRASIQEHMENAHREVSCPLCHARVENCQMEHHQSELCAKRLIKCEYCEVDCHAAELQEHEDYCGSRTEMCETCGQYILIKDEAVHIASGHAPKDRNRNKQDNVLRSKEAVESAFNAVHINRPKVPNVDRDTAARQSPIKRSNDMPQINTRASLNTEKESAKPVISDSQSNREALDQLLALHLAGDLDDIDPAYIPLFHPGNAFSRGGDEDDDEIQSLLRSAGTTGRPEYEPDVLWDYETDGFVNAHDRVIMDPLERNTNSGLDASDLIPCEFCGELCSMDYIVLHESGCRSDLVHGPPKQDLNNIQPPVISSELQSRLPFNTPSITNVSKEPSLTTHNTVLPMSSDDDDMIPCEICGEHYPSELLNEHQSLCPANEEFDNLRFDLPEADRNLPIMPLDEPVSSNKTSQEATFSPMTPDHDMIPCEICGDHFPSDIIIEHQNFCANFKEPAESPVADVVKSSDDVDLSHPPEQSEQKENVPFSSKEQNSERPNVLRAIESNKQLIHQPSLQRVKFGALPNAATHRQPRVVASSPVLTHPHPRVHNVPISVASDYNYPNRTQSKNNHSYVKNVGLHTVADVEKGSPAVNSFVRETRKALNPVKEALRQETARQNMRNSGTGTRPKNQLVRDDGASGLNRPQPPSNTHSRYSHDTKRRETEPYIPSYLRSESGDIEETFKNFLASRNVPTRIGQYRSTASSPHQRTVAQASGDRRPVAGHDHGSRLPPIVGMGAVPKKKDIRKGGEE